MTMYEVDSDRGTITVSTVDELDAVLDRATEEARESELPYVVYVTADGTEDASALGLGVGHDWSWVTYEGWRSSGSLDGGKHSAWSYGRQHTELPPGIGIPNTTVREAARQFVRTGHRPTNVVWLEAVDAG